MYPTGKGMFVRNWTAAGSPAAAVARAKGAGLAFVSPLYGWWGVGKKGPRNVSNGAKYAAAFKAAGIAVWPWVYPVPSKHASVAAALQRAQADGADGVILDPEAEYRGKPGAAAALLAAARGATSLPIGVSSYGLTSYHPTFPFAALAGADFGVPQVYDLKDNQKSNYQARGVASWRKAGFDVVIPALTTASSSPAEIAKEYAQTPVDDGGVIFWDWQTTQSSEWGAIADIDLAPSSLFGAGLVGGSLLAVALIAGFLIWRGSKGA